MAQRPEQNQSPQLSRSPSELGKILPSQAALQGNIGAMLGGRVGKSMQQPTNSQQAPQTNTNATQMGKNEYISEILKMEKEITSYKTQLITLYTNDLK